MGNWEWTVTNIGILLNAVGVIGGLLFTAFSIRSETQTRRVSNLLSLTKGHREIWIEFSHSPELSRVVDPQADLSDPLTEREEIFVGLVILHLSSVHQAMKDKLVLKPKGLQEDIRSFFSLPIPKLVWDRSKLLQNDDFVAFVEGCFGDESAS